MVMLHDVLLDNDRDLSINFSVWEILCIKLVQYNYMPSNLYFFFFYSLQKIELPLMDNVQTIPPPFVVRTLLIYSRHAGQLQFNPSDAVSVSEHLPHATFLSSVSNHVLFLNPLVQTWIFAISLFKLNLEMLSYRKCFALRTSFLM